MTRTNRIAALNELSASEDVFTTAQATRPGIPRKALSQAIALDRTEHIIHGAYELFDTPINFAIRKIDPRNIIIVEGLPTTRTERTLIDLCLDFESPSLIKDAFRDAMAKNLDVNRLEAILADQSSDRLTRNTLSTIEDLLRLRQSKAEAESCHLVNFSHTKTYFEDTQGPRAKMPLAKPPCLSLKHTLAALFVSGGYYGIPEDCTNLRRAGRPAHFPWPRKRQGCPCLPS